MRQSSVSSTGAPRRTASRIVSIDDGKAFGGEVGKNPRLYQVEVAGKIFQGPNARALLKLAVAAKRSQRDARDSGLPAARIDGKLVPVS